MTTSTIQAAIEALDDEDVRSRVASGDLADLSSFELSDDETAGVQELAQRWDEILEEIDAERDVEGFQMLGVKGSSLIWERRMFPPVLKFMTKQPTIDRTASTVPLGGLTTPGVQI